MIPIPQYLQEYAAFIACSDIAVRFSVACSCGNPWLEVYENCLKKSEKPQAERYEKACRKLACGPWGATVTRDEDGTVHHWKLLTPFGLKGWKKEIHLPPMPTGSRIGVVKCRCPQCGKEFTVFDSRRHGYAAVYDTCEQEVLDYIPQFKPVCKKCKVEIKIHNDPAGNPDFEKEADFSNGFDWINLYAISENGKKSTIFSFEAD